MTDGTDAIYDENETQLLCSIRLGIVYEKKTIEENDMTERISLIYTENKTELFGPI